MRLSNRIYRFQEGGPMPAEAMGPEGAPQGPQGPGPEGPQGPGGPQGGDQMMQQAAGIAQQLIQEAGPEMAGMIFQIGLEMLQSGGQPGPQEQLPPEEAQPAFQRMGGRMVRIK